MIDTITPVDGQLVDYNKRDLEGFLTWYSDDIQGYDLDGETLLFTGIEAMRAHYAVAFQSPILCQLKSRTVLGTTCIDFEHLTKPNTGTSGEAIAIYAVNPETGKIDRVRFTKGQWK